MGTGTPISKEEVIKNRDTVNRLAIIGCTDKEIGFTIGISEEAVRKHHRRDLDVGRANLRASIRKTQIQLALDEKHPTMLIWLGKQYLGQREPKQDVSHSGGVTVEKVLFEREIQKIKEIEEKEIIDVG